MPAKNCLHRVQVLNFRTEMPGNCMGNDLYLAGKPFILQTDHKPLSYLNQAKFENNQIMRWGLALLGYDYKVERNPGKDNIVADYLSRIIH